MQSMKWALVAVATVIATPALAASDGDNSSPAVWIALGAVFLGAFTTLISALLTDKAKKKKQSADE